MGALYGWVKNIIYYLVFLTVLIGLLPSGKYEKYIRLFAGMVLIMVTVSPFFAGIRLEDKIAGYFEEFSFQNDAGDFQKEIYGMEKKRLENLISQYEEAVAVDVKQMAEEAGLEVTDVKVRIEENQSLDSFGKVTEIQVKVNGMLGEDREKASRLKRKAAGYYQLEEKYVEIQYQNEQRQVVSRAGSRNLPADSGNAVWGEKQAV